MVAELSLTMGGLDGMKAYAASMQAASAARAASNYAIKMAQSASLAETKALQARVNLEKYVFGTAVSSVPPVVSPMLPAGVSNYPSYPYVNSPVQWGQGVPPLAVSGIDPTYAQMSAFFQLAEKKMRTAGIDFIPSTTMKVQSNQKFTGYVDMVPVPSSTVRLPNKSLEYHQSIVNLHDNIKEACKELTRRDNNVKEDLEILALERNRLGYLRDELSRRAAMIAGWEKRAKVGEDFKNGEFPSQKEVDKMNALRVELEIRKRREYKPAGEDAVVQNVPLEEVLLVGPVHTPPFERRSFATSGLSLFEKAPSEHSVADAIEPDRSSSPGGSNSRAPSEEIPQLTKPVVDALKVDDEPMPNSPKPYPYNEFEATKFYHEMTLCLDKLWVEYSTSVSEEVGHEVRLMTLPNLIRLCGDADFGVSVSDVIAIFLSLIRSSETSFKLVEQRYFMVLLQSIFKKSSGDNPADLVQLTEQLFNEYLIPLSQRMRLQERSLSYKHPPLPKSPIAALNRRPKFYSN